jgi:hypothetical protein
LKNPTKGDIIPGSKGLRKIRVLSSGRGKRGGSRVISIIGRKGIKEINNNS